MQRHDGDVRKEREYQIIKPINHSTPNQLCNKGNMSRLLSLLYFDNFTVSVFYCNLKFCKVCFEALCISCKDQNRSVSHYADRYFHPHFETM